MTDRYRLPNALMDEMEKMRKRIKELEAQKEELEKGIENELCFNKTCIHCARLRKLVENQ